MTEKDVRWKQRLNNYSLALSQLKSAVDLTKTRPLSNLEKQGIIQAFEFTHELAWNVMKDYFEYQGNTQITGSRDATKESFQKGIIQNGDVWMEMLKSRNQTSHTYNVGVANDIVDKITKSYFELFEAFAVKMLELSQK